MAAADGAARYRNGRCRLLLGRVVPHVSRVRPLGPRERLLAGDLRTCSDIELLALVLDGGAGRASALALAARVLASAGGLASLDRIDAGSCGGLADLPPRQAVLVHAALEIGRRAVATTLAPRAPIRDAAAVWAHFRGRLPQLDREVF